MGSTVAWATEDAEGLLQQDPHDDEMNGMTR
jgi:hypothetical protein